MTDLVAAIIQNLKVKSLLMQQMLQYRRVMSADTPIVTVTMGTTHHLHLTQMETYGMMFTCRIKCMDPGWCQNT